MGKNTDIKAAAVSADIRLWEVAEKIGIADTSLSRKLRKELPEEQKKFLLKVIIEIQEEHRKGRDYYA